MNGKDIELTRRRVLGGVATIGAASAATGAGTFAYFSDTESSSGNVVNAGTLDLGSATGSTIKLENAVPGAAGSSTTFTSTYTGSVAAEIDIDFSISESSITETAEPSSNNTEIDASTFAQYVEVTEASVDIGSTPHEENLLSNISNNADGFKDLDTLVSAAPFDAVTGNNAADGEDVAVTIGLKLHSSAGNGAQADGVDLTVDIIAEQPGKDNP